MTAFVKAFLIFFVSAFCLASSAFAHGMDTAHMHPHGLESVGLGALLLGLISFAAYRLVRKFI